MGQFFRTARAIALGAFGVSALAVTVSAGLLLVPTDSAFAAKAKPKAPTAPVSEADQKKAEQAAARQAYDAGVKSYAAGKFQPAVDLLSTALRGGGLASGDMAKALYLRGVSYKRLSKPGLAISDLTSALWLKNGLGEADQKAALAERAEAYRMAGLGDGTSGSDNVSVADPNPTPAGSKAAAPPLAAQAAAAPTVATPAAPKKGSKAKVAAAPLPAAEPVQTVTRQAPDSQAAIDAANARRNAAAPVEGGLYSAATATLVGEPARMPAATANQAAVAVPAPIPAQAAAPAAPAQTVAAAPPTISAPLAVPAASKSAPMLTTPPINGLPPAQVPTSQENGPSTISGFFSNMFGGGAKTDAAAPPQGASAVTTASTTPAAPVAGNWTNATSVASGAKTAAASPAAAAVTPSGKYKLHIAAVRSRAEAEALAQKLTTQQGAALKSRMPVVDEAVIGSMGTFYRVRVGSYATADEPRGVCNTLRASGFDCLVVTN